MREKPVRLTKTTVDRLKPPVPTPPATKTQAFYRDDTLTGFAVRVTDTGAKSFVVESRVNGKSRRKTIGKYPKLTVEKARKLAKERIGQIAAGKDPDAEKRDKAARAVTLSEAFNAMLEERTLKEKTVYTYKRVMVVAFRDWQRKAVADITKDMVGRRHREIAKDHGEAYANLSMRVLRSVLNFAAARYENASGQSILPENPVRRLSATRSWYRVERRQTVIKAQQLKPWFHAVMALENTRNHHSADVVRDFLLFVLLTGLRKQEAARLTWRDVDLEARTVTITDTKNREPHTLPLSDFLLDLLRPRLATATGEYVFPGPGASGYLVEPKRQVTKVKATSGVDFTIHDLRRTFITIAESLDIPAYALKRLLNHKMSGDVTAGYIVTDVERLRKPMQQVTDYILKAAGVKKTADVMKVGQRQAT